MNLNYVLNNSIWFNTIGVWRYEFLIPGEDFQIKVRESDFRCLFCINLFEFDVNVEECSDTERLGYFKGCIDVLFYVF